MLIQPHIALFLVLVIILIFAEYISLGMSIDIDNAYNAFLRAIVFFVLLESIGWIVYWGADSIMKVT